LTSRLRYTISTIIKSIIIAPRTYIDIATRALIITLKSPLGGKITIEIHEKTGILVCTINSIYTRAIERGFDPNHLLIELKDEYLKDIPRSSRPPT
jgi:hypothetical protein